MDHDSPDAVDRPGETLAHDRSHPIRVVRVAVYLPVPPPLFVRPKEGLDQALALSEVGQLVQDRGVDLIEEFLLRGQDDLLALQFRTGQGLDPRSLRGALRLLLPLREQLRSFGTRVLENPLSLCGGRNSCPCYAQCCGHRSQWVCHVSIPPASLAHRRDGTESRCPCKI